MFTVYRVFYSSDLTVGTHDGYCSGNECKDEEYIIREHFDMSISKKNIIFFNFFLKHFSLEEIVSIFDLMDFLKQSFEQFYFFDGTFQCHPSNSGLHHDYRINKQKITSIEFYQESENCENIFDIKDDFRNEINNILYFLKENKVVKDMRVLFIKKYLE